MYTNEFWNKSFPLILTVSLMMLFVWQFLLMA